MAESRYGRLFTEADVKRVMARVLADALEELAPLIAEGVPPEDPRMAAAADRAADRSAPLLGDLTFPADEPLFLLRGQDEAAPDAICVLGKREYDYASLAHLAGASEEHVVAACRAASAMREWQAANPDRVKVPD